LRSGSGSTSASQITRTRTRRYVDYARPPRRKGRRNDARRLPRTGYFASTSAQTSSSRSCLLTPLGLRPSSGPRNPKPSLVWSAKGSLYPPQALSPPTSARTAKAGRCSRNDARGCSCSSRLERWSSWLSTTGGGTSTCEHAGQLRDGWQAGGWTRASRRRPPPGT
jgi:hypothetical protein